MRTAGRRRRSIEKEMEVAPAGVEWVGVDTINPDIPLEFESPESKTIRSAHYEPGTRLMMVLFQAIRNNKPVAYVYDGVPPVMWEEFVGAASKGSFFTARIRPLYAGKKVEE